MVKPKYGVGLEIMGTPKIQPIGKHAAIRKNGVPTSRILSKRPKPMRAIAVSKALQKRREAAPYLFPKDCYNGHLQNHDPMDMVAKLECATVAGMDIPDEFSEQDLLATWVPDRRTIAFGYACLLPDILDNYGKAARFARVPSGYVSMDMYRDIRIFQWLSSFWKLQITAMSGTAYIYAQKFSKKGSQPHLKTFLEITGNMPQDAEQRMEKSLHLHLPEGSNLQIGSGQKKLPAHEDLEAEPA